jgi:riboflavin synthase
MFTGIVAGRGLVRDVRPDESDAAADAQRSEQESAAGSAPAIRLTIAVPSDFGVPGSPGESVAINGCCLTAVDIDADRWSFQAGRETLSKTNLGRLARGDLVNLERALSADGRFGGHIVQGHVDGVGEVDQIDRDGDWITMWFRAPPPLLAQMVPKGSVAVDGISLTIVEVAGGRFSVALIPHTLAVTTLGIRKCGDSVNIETDILGKYVQSLVAKLAVTS